MANLNFPISTGVKDDGSGTGSETESLTDNDSDDGNDKNINNQNNVKKDEAILAHAALPIELTLAQTSPTSHFTNLIHSKNSFSLDMYKSRVLGFLVSPKNEDSKSKLGDIKDEAKVGYPAPLVSSSALDNYRLAQVIGGALHTNSLENLHHPKFLLAQSGYCVYAAGCTVVLDKMVESK